MRKYLFVCKANKLRSPFAARWFDAYCRQHDIEAEVRSAGYEADRYLRSKLQVQLTPNLIDWADRVLAMESYMIDVMDQTYAGRNVRRKAVSLDVQDRFRPFIAERPEADLITPEEALEYASIGVFGPKVFAKVLEGKLPVILGDQ